MKITKTKQKREHVENCARTLWLKAHTENPRKCRRFLPSCNQLRSPLCGSLRARHSFSRFLYLCASDGKNWTRITLNGTFWSHLIISRSKFELKFCEQISTIVSRKHYILWITLLPVSAVKNSNRRRKRRTCRGISISEIWNFMNFQNGHEFDGISLISRYLSVITIHDAFTELTIASTFTTFQPLSNSTRN